jgi:hypothetical protein
MIYRVRSERWKVISIEYKNINNVTNMALEKDKYCYAVEGCSLF